jgi:hypothetical protein
MFDIVLRLYHAYPLHSEVQLQYETYFEIEDAGKPDDALQDDSMGGIFHLQAV